MRKQILYLIPLFLTFSCGVKKQIIDKPIVFNAEREELTRDYIKKQYGLDKETSEITPKMIVLHWTVIPTADGSFEAFKEAIGHYEYQNFENHELWLELNDEYRTIKTDPGIGFMKKVRKATKKLNFKETPQKITQ